MPGAFRSTLATSYTDSLINMGKEIGYFYSRVSAGLTADSTSDTRHSARLNGESPFIAIVAGYESEWMSRADFGNLYHVSRTGGRACPAGCAFIKIHNREAEFGIYGNGVESALLYAIAASQTPVDAIRLSLVQSGLNRAAMHSVVKVFCISGVATVAATYERHFFMVTFRSRKADDTGHVDHIFRRHGYASQAIERRSLRTGHRKSVAT